MSSSMHCQNGTICILLLTIATVMHALPLHVHVLPHSHCDAGWQQTFESYWTHNVSKILENTLSGNGTLMSAQYRTFNWDIISYFSRWYDPLKNVAVKTLLQNQQFQFIGGGWVQSDEAIASPYARILQLTEGHRWIYSNFGIQYVPKSLWQIDVFGGSSASPRLAIAAGYRFYVNERIPLALQQHQLNNGESTFLWNVGEGENAISILTANLGDPVNDYCTPGDITQAAPMGGPDGFDWEGSNVQLNPIIDSLNVEARSRVLKEIWKSRQSSRRKSASIPFLLGCDFRFQNATLEFSNMDNLISYITQNPKDDDVHVSYSTVNQWLIDEESLSQSQPLSVVHGRLLPYIWTGFYFSAADLKIKSRYVESLLTTAEAAYTHARFFNLFPLTSNLHEETLSLLSTARRNVSLICHHDAITGTATNDVNRDYMSRLHDAEQSANRALLSLLTLLLHHNSISDNVKMNDALRVSAVISQSTSTVVVFNNALSTSVEQLVSLPLQSSSIKCVVVTQVSSQTVVRSQISDNHLLFIANIPPLGYETYRLTPLMESCNTVSASTDNFIENSVYKITFDLNSGLMSSLLLKKVSTTIPLQAKVVEWEDNGSAYSFLPTSNHRIFNKTNDNWSFTILNGPITSDATLTLTNSNGELLFHQTIRLIHLSSVLESHIDIAINLISSLHNSYSVNLGLLNSQTNASTTKVYIDDGISFASAPIFANSVEKAQSESTHPSIGGVTILGTEFLISACFGQSVAVTSVLNSGVDILFGRMETVDSIFGFNRQFHATITVERTKEFSLNYRSSSRSLIRRKNTPLTQVMFNDSDIDISMPSSTIPLLGASLVDVWSIGPLPTPQPIDGQQPILLRMFNFHEQQSQSFSLSAALSQENHIKRVLITGLSEDVAGEDDASLVSVNPLTWVSFILSKK